MCADIAVGERAEDGVDQRMQHDVGIRMSGQARGMRDADAAEHDMIAVAKGMHVETRAGADVGRGRPSAALRRARNPPRVVSLSWRLLPRRRDRDVRPIRPARRRRRNRRGLPPAAR